MKINFDVPAEVGWNKFLIMIFALRYFNVFITNPINQAIFVINAPAPPIR
jgi:hypothetical protein